MYIHFITFGCKINTYETACMTAEFEKNGFIPVNNRENADIFLINSCTVTSESDSKLRQTLRKLRREHPHAVIALTGCYPQAFPEKAYNEDCDVITGTKSRMETVSAIKEFCLNREKLMKVSPYDGKEPFEKMQASTVDGHTRAFVKIQDGCSRFCSYCIIPYARGRIRSKPLGDIINEVTLLAENGYREIVLSGINLAFYGRELGIRLADAVETVGKINGIERIRLGSLEPEMLTDDDLKRFGAVLQFCPSFHLSLQSGCDKTLSAMNRHYSTKEFYSLVKKIREYFPDCGITADLMVGFPQETEDDHRISMEFVRKVGFSDINVFPYSLRGSTKAADMDGQIPQDVKKRRAREMTETGALCRKEYLKSLIGKEFPVLFEREKSDGIHHGYAPNYINIKILTKNSEKSLRKTIFYVKIDKIGDDCCFGHILPDGSHSETNI